MKSKFLQKTLLAGVTSTALILGACISGGDDHQAKSASMPNAEIALYELPPELVEGAQVSTSAKVAAKELDRESIWSVYKPIPAYIKIAENARKRVAQILTNLKTRDLPREFESTDDTSSVRVITVDSLENEWSRIIFENTKRGEKLTVTTQIGSVTRGLATFENTEKGLYIRVGFSNRNEATEGHKLRVFIRNEGELANLGDPRVVVVNAIRLDDRVYVSGKSFSPEFRDQFWSDNKTVPSIYAFKAFANETKGQAILKAAFGPSNLDGPSFMKDYALDDRTMHRLRERLIKEIDEQPLVLKAFYYSIETGEAVETGTDGKLAIYDPVKTIDDITREDIEKFADIQIEGGLPNPDYVELATFSRARQPIFLTAGAKIIGNADFLSSEEILVDESELDKVPDLEEIDYNE